MVWLGLVWFELFWFGLVWFDGLVWFGLGPSQQIHQLKQEKSYFFAIHTFFPYIMTNIWKIKVCIANKYDFPVLIGEFVEMD